MIDATNQRPIIFLDIDGVLNRLQRHDNGYMGTLPECVQEMNRVLNETAALLVITSSWRYLVLKGSMTLKGFEFLLLSHGLDCRGRLVGTTCSDEQIIARGPQIASWMTAHHNSGQPYLVLDDDDETCRSIRYRSLNLIQINGQEGLTPGDADLVIENLKAQARRRENRRIEAQL